MSQIKHLTDEPGTCVVTLLDLDRQLLQRKIIHLRRALTTRPHPTRPARQFQFVGMNRISRVRISPGRGPGQQLVLGYQLGPHRLGGGFEDVVGSVSDYHRVQ
ncbi:hypothetical protein [Microlunatus sp. GCM10028923]|uniref:hypothetical protein n=1 Tax=Microlunatus sp. GCM10028923 TaxID=3273400 RepID=UPI00361E30B7